LAAVKHSVDSDVPMRSAIYPRVAAGDRLVHDLGNPHLDTKVNPRVQSGVVPRIIRTLSYRSRKDPEQLSLDFLKLVEGIAQGFRLSDTTASHDNFDWILRMQLYSDDEIPDVVTS